MESFDYSNIILLTTTFFNEWMYPYPYPWFATLKNKVTQKYLPSKIIHWAPPSRDKQRESLKPKVEGNSKAEEDELYKKFSAMLELKEKLDRLTKENQHLRDKAKSQELEFINQAKQMEEAECDIEKLTGLLDGMKEKQAKASDELANFQKKVETLEDAFKLKDIELTGLVKTLEIRDQTVMGLEQEVCKLNMEKKEAEDRASLLELEKTRLEKEIQGWSKKELELAWSHLSSSQELSLQLQKELTLKSKQVDDLKRDYSSHDAGGQRSREELVKKLLLELDVTIRSNNALSDQLHSHLFTCVAATSKPSASSTPKTSPKLSHSLPSSFSRSSTHKDLHGIGDFETLESRLRKALDAPTLQGADHGLLEELLLYLRQQQKQLDDYRRLNFRYRQQDSTKTIMHRKSSMSASAVDSKSGLMILTNDTTN